MSERPAPVRIDDYANPRFSPEIAAMREAVRPMADAIDLAPVPLMEQAARETGVDDFGEETFAERLDVLCRSLRDEAGLAPFGVVSNQALLVQLLETRLLVEDLLARHPEIRDIPIRRPIIIVGLPRTGTTHLHNLLSADPALRSLPYWESLEPVLPEAERPAPGEPDPRIARTQMAIDVLDAAMPLFKRMHEMTVDHVHEEIQLLAVDFSSMLFESSSYVPSFADYYQTHDQTPHYEYLRTLLQVLTWLRGGERWVLKSPQHAEQLRVVARVFPDATFVCTHRDPVRVTASVVTMIAYGSRMNSDHPDPDAICRHWVRRTQDLLDGMARDRDVLPAAQALDVRFPEFMADDMGVVADIYRVADQPLDDRARIAMADFLARHPRGRHGTVVYDLTDFGVDVEERRRALAPYAERFGLAWETENT